MTLSIIGIGLNDEKDITIKGLEFVKQSDVVYLENYTSVLNCDVSALEVFYGKKIILADRNLVEKKAEETILKDAKEKNVSLLVVGDALSATTHIDLVKRARGLGIKVNIVHNASILTAVSETGLQLYKFGKTTSIPFPEKNYKPETAYYVIKDNLSLGLHTLVLLDLRPQENKFMSISDAINVLLDIEKKRKGKVITEETLAIGCARLGSENSVIKKGKIKELKGFDFGKPVHCLIIPGKMHFAEEEFLQEDHPSVTQASFSQSQ